MTHAPAFELPAGLEAAEPPEARGLARDEVRLLVAEPRRALRHARFRDLPELLGPGDLLVVNASATLPAALLARRESGETVRLHLSTPLPPPAAPSRVLRSRADARETAPRETALRAATPGGAGPDDTALRWVVELRRAGGRVRDGRTGERLELPGGASAVLLAPYLSPGRLWVADLDLPGGLAAYLDANGSPIAYRHLTSPRPLADHQTIFAADPGSAEMPSAGRPFTRRLLAALAARGIGLAAIVLHTGVSSQELGERPYPEHFRVPAETAARVNAARRTIAVGTSAVRALETAAGPDGTVEPAEGWTSLVITPERGIRAVDGLLTGWHEPHASHLLMLEAVAGRELVERSYHTALAHGYLWHEFGDSHLILRV